MIEKPVFLTREGLNKLQLELEQLRTLGRTEVAERIQSSKDLGGAQNNAEFDDAKNEQAFVEGRILTLEGMIKNSTIISDEVSASVIQVGSNVSLVNQDGDLDEYAIVGSTEANPKEGKISNESPIGKALLGKRPGDEIEVNIPAGILRLTINKIS